MPSENKVEYLNRLVNFNRAVYILLFVITLMVKGADLPINDIQMGYYLGASVLMLCFDEFVFRGQYLKVTQHKGKISLFLMHLRTFLLVTGLSIGTLFGVLPHLVMLSVTFVVIFILAQDVLFSDVFNSFTNIIRLVIVLLIYCGVVFFGQYWHDFTGLWRLTFIVAAALVIVVTALLNDFYYTTVMKLDDKYTKLYFKNTDLMAENDKLIQFREKVEKVNSEINYQKINLTKANDDLAKANEEARSLIQVMKYFSASFDVEKNAHVMLDNVKEIRKTDAICFYIDKDVYMNDNPYLEIITKDELTETLLKQDVYSIYENVKSRKSVEPMVLCKNYDYKYPYLTGGSVCNAVAFPAYENDTVYGVMIVTSSKYDFFASGYSFYESSIMDFTSALISDRLYLKTEDMAKKDGLTKVYNRIYFNQYYNTLKDEIVAAGDKLTVCMLDIDHFKSVNDTYGHLAGDEVIKAVARVDAKYAKLYGGKAVRFGGEEFLLILRNTDVDTAYGILEKMHDEITSNIVEFEDLKIKVNTSMGLASYPETCDNIHEVLDRADQAMYFSKEHGRGMIVIDGREEEALKNSTKKTEDASAIIKPSDIEANIDNTDN